MGERTVSDDKPPTLQEEFDAWALAQGCIFPDDEPDDDEGEQRATMIIHLGRTPPRTQSR